jgi:hypothetical protein
MGRNIGSTFFNLSASSRAATALSLVADASRVHWKQINRTG